MRPIWVLCIIVFFERISLISAQNCAGTIILNSTTNWQYITSPNYEKHGSYPSFLDCSFIIKAPDKAHNVIEILDLEMEPQIFSKCVDYVAIYEGAVESNNTILGTYCEVVKNRQLITINNTALIKFRSDDVYEYRGVKIGFRQIEENKCPPGWIESPSTTCLKLYSNDEVDWITAQNRCLELQSNLLMIKDRIVYQFVIDAYKSVSQKLWIGYNDGLTEGTVQGVDSISMNPVSSEDQTVIRDNNDDNDCLSIDASKKEQFIMDSCASLHGFICEMRKDWKSTLYNPPIRQLVEGSYVKSSHYPLWLLLFIIGILFLVIMLLLCFMCLKQKENNRVHTQSEIAQQNAFMNNAPQATSAAAAPSQTSNPTIERKDTDAAAPLAPPSKIENHKPPKKFPSSSAPNRVPMSEEPSEAEKIVETVIMRANEQETSGADAEPISLMALSTQPKPQPRTLPPMPNREPTLQSINTRGGGDSTLRTRRNRDLFDRPVMHVLDNVSAISLDEFWSNKRP